MDLKQMEYFQAVVDAGSISEAARRLHVAQPPISYQMKMLENELGVQLFERGARHIRLTKAGHTFYTRVVRILEMADNAARDTIRAGKGQTLYLGMTSTTVAIMQPVLKRFAEDHPDVHYQLYDGSTFELRHLLETGVIEGAVLRTPFPVDEFDCRLIRTEAMLAGFPAEWSSGENRTPEGMPAPVGSAAESFCVKTRNQESMPAKSSEESIRVGSSAESMHGKSSAESISGKNEISGRISLPQLARYPLSVYRRYYDLIHEQFTAQHLEPDYFSICDDARTSLLWCSNGCAVCLFPESLRPALPDGIQTLTIDSEELRTSILFAAAKERQPSDLITEFTGYLKYAA
ncbi:MAG: LysR family transcriptional regulator [Bilifractor sp.]|jgi:DNA-binding transcriptional LysR family regulator